MHQLPWLKIVEQGIVFRPSPTHPQAWEYTIPALSPVWYGPYRTKETARQVALEDLLQQMQIDVNVSDQPKFCLNLKHEPGNLQEYFTELQHQLAELHKMRAVLGHEYANYIDPLIEQVEKQLDSVQRMLAEQKE
jgi:hypothetical protein